MNFHSILYRELLICSKRATTFYARSLIAGFAGLAALLLVKMTVNGAVAPSETGRVLLWTLAAMGLFCALFEGILLTIDSIARERREGTLGLLFLSNLTARDIVIGKAGSAGMRTLFALLAASPAPALTFLFGGVSLGDYLKVVLMLLNALFFALSLGLFVSCFEGPRKNRTTGLVLLWFLIAAPVAGVFLQERGAIFTGVMVGASPVAPMLALVMPAPGDVSVFPASLAISNLLAWSMLIGAGYLLNRNWRALSAQAARPPVTVKRWRETRGDSNPVLQLAHRRAPSLRNFWTSCGVAGVAALFVLGFGPLGRQLPAYAVILCFLHVILSINISAIASKALAEDRSSGLLELLLTTPLPEEEIVSGHLLALKRITAQAFGFLVLLGCYWLFLLSLNVQMGQWILVALAYGGALLLHLFEMTLNARLGLWKGLQSGSSGNAFRRMMGVTGLSFLGVIVFSAVIAWTLWPAFPRDVLPAAAAIAAVIGSLAAMSGLLGSSTARLNDSLRSVAAVPARLVSK